MSSFAKQALIAIRKNPEIFSALEEFERTKKIPKFTYRKRVDLTIDENILQQFRRYCADRSLNMSRLVEKYIRDELRKDHSSIDVK